MAYRRAVHLRMDEVLYWELRAEAAERDLPISDVMRERLAKNRAPSAQQNGPMRVVGDAELDGIA